MKFAVIITILMVASFHVATAKTLAEAMYELRPIMNLHSWDAAWNLRRNADYAVCHFSEDLNQVLDAAFDRIGEDAVYISLATTMITAGVPWEDFIDNELKRAVGHHDHTGHTCTTLSYDNGIVGLRNQLRGYFDQDLVQATFDRLISESPEFAAVHADFSSHQVEIRAIRCSPEVQAVATIMRGQGIDFEFIFDVFQIIFGWSAIEVC